MIVAGLDASLPNLALLMGHAVVTEKGMAVNVGKGPEYIFSSKQDSSVNGHIVIGELMIQFGRVVDGAQAGETFKINYPRVFSGAPCYVSVTPAGNDFPGTYNSCQIDSLNKPNESYMTVGVREATGSEYYYWLAIGPK